MTLIRQSCLQFFSAISSECLKPQIYIKLYLAYAACYIIRDAIVVKFPNDWAWGELLIGYQGGLTRRGLFGQMLYILSPYVNTRFFTIFLLSAIFFYLIYITYKESIRAFGKLTTLLFFAWPSYFLFLIKDPASFMRRDIIVDLILLLTMLFLAKSLRENKAVWAVAGVFCAIFCFSILLYEATLFYWPLPALLLGTIFWRARKGWIWFLLMALLFSAAIFYAFHFVGTGETREAMCSAWQEIFPDFRCQGGMATVGISLAGNVENARPHHTNIVALCSLFFGMGLAFLPLIFLCAAFPILSFCRVLFGGWKLVLLACAAASPWIMPVLATDFGRHISMACMEYFFFCISLQNLEPRAPRPWLEKLRCDIARSPGWRMACVLALLIIGTSWTQLHFAGIGESYLILSGFPSLFHDFFFLR